MGEVCGGAGGSRWKRRHTAAPGVCTPFACVVYLPKRRGPGPLTTQRQRPCASTVSPSQNCIRYWEARPQSGKRKREKEKYKEGAGTSPLIDARYATFSCGSWSAVAERCGNMRVLEEGGNNKVINAETPHQTLLAYGWTADGEAEVVRCNGKREHFCKH